MTRPDDGREVGQLLASSVPDLPTPVDRLAAVGHRVRRRRARQVVLAAACAGLVLLGTAAIATAGRTGTGTVDRPAGPQRPGAGNCPAQLPTFPHGNGSLPKSAPGALAPAGAVRAVLCRYDPLPEYQMIRPGPARQLVLTRDVTGLVDTLNQLPVNEPIDECFARGGGGYLTLVYGDGTTATIELSDGCGFVRRGAITRHNGQDAVRAFDDRYRQQELAAAVPDSVPPANCAPQLAPAVPPGRFNPDPVTDAWLHTYDADHRYLPAPLVVVTACRYLRNGDGSLVRTRQVIDREVVRQAADAVQATYATVVGEVPYDGCTSRSAVRTMDVLVLRDVVGETFEVRAARDTCQAVTFGFDGAPLNTAMLAMLNQLLGPPA